MENVKSTTSNTKSMPAAFQLKYVLAVLRSVLPRVRHNILCAKRFPLTWTFCLLRRCLGNDVVLHMFQIFVQVYMPSKYNQCAPLKTQRHANSTGDAK